MSPAEQPISDLQHAAGAADLQRLRNEPPARLCLIRLSAIGDTCHTLPVVRTLQKVWPATKITWIIGQVESGLLGDIAGIEFITFDKRLGWRAYPTLYRRLAGRRFDLLLHMHASMRANLASLCVRADLRLGFDRARARDSQWLFTNRHIPARAQRHVMDGLFEFAEALGIHERELRWDIPLTNAERTFAAGLIEPGRPTLVISPCSSQRFRNFRNWSAENYAAVADHAARHHGARILLTGGSTRLEADYGQQIVQACASAPRNLIGQTTLKQLFAILERADLVLCPDSGPAHMATAAGTPVVGLYATSNRWRTGPYFSQQLVVDKYPQAVEAEFGVPVEELRWGARVRNPEAMALIELDEVVSKVDSVLGAAQALDR